jgi:hypothetical protein
MPEQPSQQLNVKAQDKLLQGRYANIVSVTSQEREVVIDFINRVGPEGQLVGRMILNRFTAQELVQVLQSTMQQWEKMKYEVPPVKEDGKK